MTEFIGNDEGDLFCPICKRQGVWTDCPLHPDDHYSIYCPKCGVEAKDCEENN